MSKPELLKARSASSAWGCVPYTATTLLVFSMPPATAGSEPLHAAVPVPEGARDSSAPRVPNNASSQLVGRPGAICNGKIPGRTGINPGSLQPAEPGPRGELQPETLL